MKWYVTAVLFLTACGGTASVSGVGAQSAASKATCAFQAGSKQIAVSWDANREKAVNTTGGGYRVYYCGTQDFAVATAAYIDVPATAAKSAPTTAQITGIGEGTLYVKVVAYSALAYAGATTSKSTPSTEITVDVP